MSVCGGHSGRWEARQICPELALPSKLRPTVSTSRADIAAFAAGTAALGHSKPSFQCLSVYRQSAHHRRRFFTPIHPHDLIHVSVVTLQHALPPPTCSSLSAFIFSFRVGMSGLLQRIFFYFIISHINFIKEGKYQQTAWLNQIKFCVLIQTCLNGIQDKRPKFLQP